MEAVLGSGFMGDVAVDDIVVAAGGCGIQPVEAASGANYTTPAVPTLQPPDTTTSGFPGIYDCDFEGDWCLWTCNDMPVRRNMRSFFYFIFINGHCISQLILSDINLNYNLNYNYCFYIQVKLQHI